MYVYHAPTVTPLARHLPREWEALSNTAKQKFIRDPDIQISPSHYLTPNKRSA